MLKTYIRKNKLFESSRDANGEELKKKKRLHFAMALLQRLRYKWLCQNGFVAGVLTSRVCLCLQKKRPPTFVITGYTWKY